MITEKLNIGLKMAASLTNYMLLLGLLGVHMERGFRQSLSHRKAE